MVNWRLALPEIIMKRAYMASTESERQTTLPEADPNKPVHGMTPLQAACLLSDKEAKPQIEALLKQGALACGIGKDRKNALEFAQAHGRGAEITRTLANAIEAEKPFAPEGYVARLREPIEPVPHPLETNLHIGTKRAGKPTPPNPAFRPKQR